MDRRSQVPGRVRTFRPLAIAAVLVVLAGLAAWGRLSDERRSGIADPGPLPEPRLCAGVEVDGELLGLALGDTWGALVASAVERLGLPVGCPPPVEAGRERGALLRFAVHGGSSCTLSEVAILPAPARLLCGAGLDVNRDLAADLELLPGVGPVKARALVESREQDGPFERRADLERVRGIGPRTAARIAPWLDGIE